MITLKDFTFWNLMVAYKDNQDIIRCYIAKKKGQSVEGMVEDGNKRDIIMGINVGLFLVLFWLSLGLFIWAVMLLVKYNKSMPQWSLISSVILLAISGPVIPIILVYATKNTK
jgi:hypothetical protein